MRRLVFVAVCMLSVVTAGSAHAEESAPSLKVTITPAATGNWSLRIQNTGDSPIRIPADARLLSFEITPPSADVELDKKTKAPLGTARCTLPDDARPSTDEGRELVIPATRAWSTTFDPLFYCFGARERALLVAGATIKGHFGWKTPAATKGKTAAASPPFAVTPVGASVGKIAPQKGIDADPITLTDAMVPKANATTADGEAPKVFLTLPETMDAAKGVDLSTTVTLVNESERPITLLFRPDMLQFTVNGPGGSLGCGSQRNIGSPMRELFVTIGSKARTSLSVLFTATCGSGSFDQPGLYRMSAKLDTTGASGRSINVKTWDDVAMTKAPLLLRIREAPKPTAPMRPSLE